MYKKLLFLFIGIALSGLIFMSCSDDDSSTNPPPTPECTILSPNGGEVLQMGNVVKIKFENDLTDTVAMHLYKGGNFLMDIEAMVTTNDSLEWLIPTTLDIGTDYKVKIGSIEDSTKYDFSDNSFTIAPAGDYIIVRSSNGGDIWLKGTTKQITWYDNISSSVNIFLLKNGVPVMDIFGTPQASSGTKSWSIPGTLTDGADYGIQIVSVDNPAVNDKSDNFFCLATNDNTQNVVGSWNSTGTWSKWNTVFEFYANGTWLNTLYTAEYGTWSMIGNGLKMDYEGNSICFLAIVDDNDLEGSMSQGGSTGTWSAVRMTPEVTAPNGGEVWMRGTTQTITWTPVSKSDVILSLTDSTGVVQNIATVADSLGTYDWAIPTSIVPGAAYKIKVTQVINSASNDESDNYICISADISVDVVGEWGFNWYWKAYGVIEFFNDNTWDYGTYELTGNGIRWNYYGSDTYYIGIVGVDVMSGTNVDTGGNPGNGWDAHRLLEVVTPNGGAVYQGGDVVAITWYETLSAQNVTVDLYENDVFSRNLTTVDVNSYTSYNWTVPSNVVTSTKYKIRMTSTTSDIYDESDDYFTIDAVPATPAILDEDFGDGTADGWTSVDGTWTVADGVYSVASGTYGVSTTEFGTPMTGNYVMESRLRKTAGSVYNFGIVMNGDSSSLTSQGDWSDCAMLIITTDGSYQFAVSVGGIWSGTGWAFSSDILTGLGTWNILKVIVDNSNSNYHIFINGVYQTTVNNGSLTEGSVGLKMYDVATAGTGEFDYVKVSSINKSTMQNIQIKRVDLKPVSSVNE